jgi:sucrose phosphorylase
MPGTPQIWYLDLFAGANDDEAADRGGSGGHKEINRTNLTADDVHAGLTRRVVLDQLEMLRLRNTSDAFNGELDVIATESERLALRWQNAETSAMLEADLATATFTITHVQGGQLVVLAYD